MEIKNPGTTLDQKLKFLCQKFQFQCHLQNIIYNKSEIYVWKYEESGLRLLHCQLENVNTFLEEKPQVKNNCLRYAVPVLLCGI